MLVKAIEDFLLFFSFLHHSQPKRTVKPLGSKNPLPSLFVPRSYGIIIRSYSLFHGLYPKRVAFNTHACSAKAKIAGVPIIQRLGGQQQWTPYVRCLQRSCSREGGKRQIFRGETRLCKLAPRVNSRVCVSVSLCTVPLHVINQRALCIVYAAREETHRVCFAVHTGIERKYRARTTSMTRNAAHARVHARRRESLILAHSVRQSISNRSSIFLQKEKRKEERVYFSDIPTKARNRRSSLDIPSITAALFLFLLENLRRGPKKREKLFIHRLSTLLRAFQSPVEFRILSFPYVHIRGYTRGLQGRLCPWLQT